MREKEVESNDIIEIDVRKLLLIYLQRWWVIILCGIIVGVGVLIYTLEGITPLYRAGAMIYVNNSRNTQDIDYMTDSNLNASQKLVVTYETIAKSSRVLDEAAKALNNDYTADELLEMISTSQENNTGIFEIDVLHPDAKEAQRIANVMADVAPQIIAEIVEGSSASVINYAKLPEHHYSPNYVKNTAMGVLTGCFIAVVYLTIHSLLDVRIKDEKDLSDVSPYPILGLIPDFSQTREKSKAHRSSHGHQDVSTAHEQSERRSKG